MARAVRRLGDWKDLGPCVSTARRDAATSIDQGCNYQLHRRIPILIDRSGGIEDFDGYSEHRRRSEIIWSDSTLDTHLNEPNKIVPVAQWLINEQTTNCKQLIAYPKIEEPTVNYFCP